VNRAAQTTQTPNQIGIRIDGSAPVCKSDAAILGSGLYPHVQKHVTWLQINGFDQIRDDQTGVYKVTYAMEDVTTGGILPLSGKENCQLLSNQKL
jgi:hypothetical protein